VGGGRAVTYCNYGIIDADAGLPGIVEGNFNHQLCRNDTIKTIPLQNLM
jgi:hypothetical protein